MTDLSSKDFRSLFADQVKLDEREVDLERSALYLAGEEFPELDVDLYLGRLDTMSGEVRHFVENLDDREQLARALNDYLFDRRKFTGNPQDYYNTENSFLNRVMDMGVGIPITLSVLYLALAWRLGLRCHGVGMPGHFLVCLQDLDLYLDPFHSGQLLSSSDCRRLASEMFGPGLPWRDEFLAPCSSKAILFRMLNNLRQIYLNNRDFQRHAGALERMLLINPGETPLYLELAQSQVHLGDPAGAAHSLKCVLERSGNVSDLAVAKQLLEILCRSKSQE